MRIQTHTSSPPLQVAIHEALDATVLVDPARGRREAMVLARVLREESSFGAFRLGLHLITRPGDESVGLDDPAVADAALLSALAKEMTLAVSGSCYSALTRLERLEVSTSAHPLLDQLTTCSPDCHLITDLAPGYQALVLQQTEKLTGQRRSTARESTF